MNEKPTKFTVAFSLPTWKWNHDVQEDQKARIASGYTSLRITKQTLHDLQEFRNAIIELQHKAQRAEGNYGGSYGNLSMDDLLGRLATGNMGLSSSFVAPPAAKPAKKQRRKARA